MPRRHRRFFIPPCPPLGRPLRFDGALPWLAPLAGYSDLPFRLLCREQGAAVCETEMISARGLLHQSPGTADLLLCAQQDQPLVAQLFGGEPESMGQALLLLRKAGFTLFDCNMGCPVRKVLRQKAGAALMSDVSSALEIAGAMLGAARAKGNDLPEEPALVGFKLRLPPNPGDLASFALRLQDLGAGWITLHPRYASQGYAGKADHNFTSMLARELAIPVIASGDMLTGAGGKKCLEETGAAAVMYARGALANPHIFSEHAAAWRGQAVPRMTHSLLRAIIGRHIDLTHAYAGEERAFIKMRSIIPRYVRMLPGVHELRLRLCACRSWDSLFLALDEFLARAAVSSE